MSTKAPHRQNGSVRPAPLRQDSTQCRILGVDQDGYHHVYDRERNHLVVLNEDGIDVQYDLDELPQDVRDWMHYVSEERGWQKEQWLGYKWAEALAGTVQDGEL